MINNRLTLELSDHAFCLSSLHNILKSQLKILYHAKPFQTVFRYLCSQFLQYHDFISQDYLRSCSINLSYLSLTFLTMILFQKHFWLQLQLYQHLFQKLFLLDKFPLHLMDLLQKIFLHSQNQPISYLLKVFFELYLKLTDSCLRIDFLKVEKGFQTDDYLGKVLWYKII